MLTLCKSPSRFGETKQCINKLKIKQLKSVSNRIGDFTLTMVPVLNYCEFEDIPPDTIRFFEIEILTNAQVSKVENIFLQEHIAAWIMKFHVMKVS